MGCWLHNNRDVISLLAKLLSDQYVFFASVSRDWRNAWGDLPKLTQAVTADTSVSQLHWSFFVGLKKVGVISERIVEHCGVDILQCASYHGCVLTFPACVKAVALERIEMIAWALNDDWSLRDHLCSAAATAGSLRILKWARAKGCSWYGTCASAAGSGRLDILRWARSEGCPWDAATCSNAAEGGHLGILQWVREKGADWCSETCEKAAFRGHLELLQWARANGAGWNSATIYQAARGGHLELLQWARAQECPWTPLACAAAAENGHLDVLEWLLANGCPWPTHTCLAAAARGHVHILEWIHARY